MDILKAFNDHFVEFVDDIANYFSDNLDIQTTANALKTMRKANPKLIMIHWKESIVDVYETEINNGDLSFFINKQYDRDINGMDNSDHVLQAIDKLRKPISDMPSEDQDKSMKYIQNLCKLCNLYYLNRN
jgi:hypothetical protein